MDSDDAEVTHYEKQVCSEPLAVSGDSFINRVPCPKCNKAMELVFRHGLTFLCGCLEAQHRVYHR